MAFEGLLGVLVVVIAIEAGFQHAQAFIVTEPRVRISSLRFRIFNRREEKRLPFGSNSLTEFELTWI